MATIPNALYSPRPTPQDRSQVIRPYAGGQVTAALQQIAGQVGALSDEVQRQRDVAAISEARRKLDEWERTAIFDPERGAINRRGQDAFDVPDRLSKEFDDVAGKLATGMTARQRQAFQEVAQGRRNQVANWAVRHQTRERESFEEGQYQADVKSFQDRAALFPDKAGGELALMNQRTIGYMRSKGRSTEEINAAVRDNTDKAHAGVIASLLSSEQDVEATEYFRRNKDALSADAKTRIGESLKSRSTLLKAQRNADDLVSQGISEADAIRKTRAMFEGQAEEAAVQQVRTRFAEQAAADAREVKAISTNAWSVLMERGSMSAIPPSLMSDLRARAPEEERQMRDWLQAKADRAKREASGQRAETDWPTYLRLRDAAIANPEQFVQEDLGKFAPYIAGPQLEQLQDMKDRLANPKEMRSVVTMQQQISATVNELKLTGRGNQEERGRLMSAIQQAVMQAEEAKGKPLTPQERQKEIDRLIIEGEVISGSWWKNDPDVRVFDIVKDPEQMSRFKPEISDTDRQRIVDRVQKQRGKPPSDDEVLAIYRQWKRL